jgi:hypothetical protein
VVTHSVKVPITTLDEVCATHEIVPDCMKLDVQGAELDVLQGSHRVLQRTLFLELEVEFNPQYENQPLFADVDTHLRGEGFSLLGLRRTLWRQMNDDVSVQTPWGGQIVHGDVIYFNSRFLRDPRITARDIVKLCVILSLYRQDALLNHLLRSPHPALETVPLEERRALQDALLNRPGIVPRVLGGLLRVVRRLSPVALTNTDLRRAVDSLREKDADDWHDPDFF